MLERLTQEDFHRRLNETFRLRLEQETLGLRLTEAEKLGEPRAALDRTGGQAPFPRVGKEPVPPGPQRQAFSLVFTGPPTPVLPQRIYRLEHPEMGSLDIFLVPIGIGPEGTRYQAIFN